MAKKKAKPGRKQKAKPKPSYREEEHARALHDLLTRELTRKLPGSTVCFTPMGCNSSCEGQRGQRSCTIYCFDISAPQYLARFDEKPAIPLWGRTFAQAEVIGAVYAWLAGQSPEAILEQFPFVEQQRRVLKRLQQAILEAEPTLIEHTTSELVSSSYGGDGCALWFRGSDRSCEVYYYAYNAVPDAVFFWDECRQFGAQMTEVVTGNIRTEEEFLQAIQAGTVSSWKSCLALDATKVALLARIMKCWLCDKAMPSAIQHEYPWIVLSEEAPFYEQGRGIEGEFMASWRHIDDMYKSLSRERSYSPVPTFVRQLRNAGYERTLRAGSSLSTLIVSRARRYGLKHAMPNEQYDPRKHDPYIAFDFGGVRFSGVEAPQMKVTAYLDDGEQTILLPTIELIPELDALLKRLEAMPIR
jgi:hypothetical protein